MAQEPLRQETCADFPQHAAIRFFPSSPFIPNPRGAPIVVSKFSGWGSLLNIFPLLSGIRSRFPDSPLVFLTDRRNEELASHMTLFDRILYLSTSRRTPLVPAMDLLSNSVVLRRLSPALYLDLQLHSRKRLSSFLSWASGAKTRVGFTDSRDRTRFGKLTHALYFNSHQPVREAFVQVSRLLDLPAITPVSLDLHGTIPDQDSLDALLPEARSSRTTLCTINSNASEMAYERRWPLENFRGLCRRLFEGDPSRIIVLTGTREERPYVEGLLEGLPSRITGQIRNLAGHLSFGTLAALLKRSNLFISNDSGPLHLALNLGTPTVGLFGPTHPGLAAFSEPSHKTVFLHTPLYCSPCVYLAPAPPCGGDNLCMQSISVDAVLRAAESLLERRHRTLAHLPQSAAPREHARNLPDGSPPLALYRSNVSPSCSRPSLRKHPMDTP